VIFLLVSTGKILVFVSNRRTWIGDVARAVRRIFEVELERAAAFGESLIIRTT